MRGMSTSTMATTIGTISPIVTMFVVLETESEKIYGGSSTHLLVWFHKIKGVESCSHLRTFIKHI